MVNGLDAEGVDGQVGRWLVDSDYRGAQASAAGAGNAPGVGLCLLRGGAADRDDDLGDIGQLVDGNIVPSRAARVPEPDFHRTACLPEVAGDVTVEPVQRRAIVTRDVHVRQRGIRLHRSGATAAALTGGPPGVDRPDARAEPARGCGQTMITPRSTTRIRIAGLPWAWTASPQPGPMPLANDTSTTGRPRSGVHSLACGSIRAAGGSSGHEPASCRAQITRSGTALTGQPADKVGAHSEADLAPCCRAGGNAPLNGTDVLPVRGTRPSPQARCRPRFVAR